MKFVITALLILIGIGVTVRLGIWQLDRLAQRRALNAEIAQRVQAPPLSPADFLSAPDPASSNLRTVTLQGAYDFSQQVALNNQEWKNQMGVHLITPFVIAGTERAVLVDRGWVPSSEATPAKWSQFDERAATQVNGRIQLTQTSILPSAPVTSRQDSWFRVDVAAMQGQISKPLLPVYVEILPDPARIELPYRNEPVIDLSEGPHMGYAITWFGLAAVLGLGSIGYLMNKRRTASRA